MTETITWHLHPTVWQHAVHGRHEAQIWWTEPGTKLGWLLYEVGGLDPVAQGTGTDEGDAKAQAEAELRARWRVRYEVRERNAAHGVWDRHLVRWMSNELDQDEMGEYDAGVLARDLNEQENAPA
jgi:hypothetical protein